MRVTSHPVAKSLLCLFVVFPAAFAGLVQREKRDEASLATQRPPSETLADETTEAAATSVTITESPALITSTSLAIPQSTSKVNTSLFEFPIPEGELPLEPQITPGFAVAGVILLLTGVVYAVVGIKTRWIHSFLSTAFLGSLGTSVLIVYVMTHPVTQAIQGAYVVAVVCTGLILGGLALVFKEITECLACMLGGFCLSMWLLTLQPGGLIQHTGGKVGFIAAFTIAGFGLYFTPWTRSYGMIACISFSGATVAVLGIDCFSRAGYKEFWAYLWDLNDNLFPLGTTTYPLTRGIRVEIAVIILIFLAGVISQIKLWRIIKDRRAKRDAERAEVERNLRAEEENAGREIEKRTAREKRRWERVYGDGARSPLSDSADSGVGDMENEKRIHGRISEGSTVALATRSQSPAATEPIATGILPLSVDEAMTPFRASKIIAAERVTAKDEDGARITVLVAHDDMPNGPILEDPLAPPPKEAQTMAVEAGLQQQDDAIPAAWQRNSVIRETPPNITPLPFTVPEEQGTEQMEEDRSSIATFADEDLEDTPRSRPITREGVSDSMVKRVPRGSVKMFSSLSQRSRLDKDEHSNAGAGEGESCDGLVFEMARGAEAKDESESVAANLDDMSCVSDPVSLHDWDAPKDYLMDMKLDGKTEGGEDGQKASQADLLMTPTERLLRRSSSSKELLTSKNVTANPVYSSLGARSCPDLGIAQVEEESQDKKVEAPAQEPPGSSSSRGEGRAPGQRRTSVDSVAASLTQGNLPSGLSRVAMSYRTNEWAKHLSVAETPEPETLQLADLGVFSFSGTAIEGPAPLDIAELQQTAENAAPPPAAPRSASALSNHHTLTRNNSRSGLPAQPYRSLSGTLRGKASGLLAEPIAEEGGDGSSIRGSPMDNITTPVIPEEGSLTGGSLYDMPSSGTPELSTSASTPTLSTWLANSTMQQPQPLPQQQQQQAQVSSPPTLMGMREMLLRTKVSAGLLSTPTPAEAIYTNMNNAERLHRRSPSSETGSINSYPLYDSPTLDADDIPLSQRRAMIRQSASLGNFPSGAKPQPYRSQSRASIQGLYNSGTNNNSRSKIPIPTAEAATFDSHQPPRRTSLPSEAARQAQLANFRNSVAADLAASSPIDGLSPVAYAGGGWNPPSPTMMGPYGSSTPMLNPSFGGFGGFNNMGGRASAQSLSGQYTGQVMGNSGQGGIMDVQRTLETQRSFLMEQREMEGARREAEQIEAERGQREFEERMRSGQLLGVHRDALRRMQAKAGRQI
ncbi:protein of unknown function (DUF4203) domain containing protein [Rhypophila sp. PSN 637]